jgi:hypothetical protein
MVSDNKRPMTTNLQCSHSSADEQEDSREQQLERMTIKTSQFTAALTLILREGCPPASYRLL